MYATRLKVHEAWKYCKCIGFVFYNDGRDYYIPSNMGAKILVKCSNGEIYCKECNDLPLVYPFESTTVNMLKKKYEER